eukprot:scaffold368_cov258-Pinguiococcus_pyrenoidosus.AAC.69
MLHPTNLWKERYAISTAKDVSQGYPTRRSFSRKGYEDSKRIRGSTSAGGLAPSNANVAAACPIKLVSIGARKATPTAGRLAEAVQARSGAGQ